MIGVDFIILQNLSQNHGATVYVYMILKWSLIYRPDIMTLRLSKILEKNDQEETFKVSIFKDLKEMVSHHVYFVS